MSMTDMSTLLDSLDFDDEGKSIEKLMLKHLNHGGFGSFVMVMRIKKIIRMHTPSVQPW